MCGKAMQGALSVLAIVCAASAGGAQNCGFRADEDYRTLGHVTRSISRPTGWRTSRSF